MLPCMPEPGVPAAPDEKELLESWPTAAREPTAASEASAASASLLFKICLEPNRSGCIVVAGDLRKQSNLLLLAD